MCTHVVLLAPCVWMDLEHPLDFNDSIWDPLKQLPYIHGLDWSEHMNELCWSGDDNPELCNHQLLRHLSTWADNVPVDFEMNALSIPEVEYLLQVA